MAHSSAHSSAPLAALLSQIVTAVRAVPGPIATRVVAVDGQGGAGKSSFASQLAAALGGCQIIHTDDFASWENSIDWWPELIERVLVPLARGEVAHFDSSQWESGALRPRIEIVPAEFLILEGVTASREAFRPWLTYSIWIEACRDLRLRRGLERDGEQARAQWERWIAEENGYRLRERPDERADLVVSGERDLWS